MHSAVDKHEADLLCGEESLDIFIPLMRLESKILIGNGLKFNTCHLLLIQIPHRTFLKEHY